mgnify:CR=1 FL=1
MQIMSAMGDICRVGLNVEPLTLGLGRFYRVHRRDMPILGIRRHWRSEQCGQPVLRLG